MAVSGNTLLNLGKALARELGPYAEFTATSTSGSNDLVISTALADSEAATERYGGYYLYAHSGGPAGQQQRVKRAGFTGATGTFQTATAFANTPPESALWSLLGVMPWISQDGLLGIREAINRALRKLWIRYRRPFTAVAGQTEYDMTMWYASRRRFLRLIDPDPGSNGHSPISQQSWDVVQNGEVWTLQLASAQYEAGDTFWLEMEIPANARLYISGAWADQSSPVAGLVIDADACLGDFNTVFQCSLYECFVALAVQAAGARKSYWRERLEEQRTVVSMIKLFDMDGDSVTIGEGPHNNPGGWQSVVGDHGFFSRW